MTEKMQYHRWLDFPLEDPALKEELLSIKDQDEEIFDRFYQELAFGTAGLRGVLGAGTNRMNIYTVRKATQGMADYLNEKYPFPMTRASIPGCSPKKPPGLWRLTGLPLICMTS